MNHVDMDISIEIQGYDIVAELAHGNYGAVYLGVQRSLNRLVAVKVLADELKRDKEYIKQFYHEAQVAAQLSHPNVVQAFDVGHGITEHFYFAMELVDGEDLSKKMQREGRIHWRQALLWMKEVAEGLNYGMRKKRLTHGDIKPANVMVTNDGEVKIADLGLACMGGEKKKEGDGIMCTPWYAAPEVIDNTWQIGDPRADMYSFGATLYHLISGRPVFKAADSDMILEMHQFKEPIDCSAFVNIPDKVSGLMSRLLEKNPNERFADWQKVINAMKALLKYKGLSTTHSGSHQSRKKLSSTGEHRRQALIRLKKRKRRENRVLRYYCYGLVGLVSLLVLVDFIITGIGGEGVVSVLQNLVNNFSGE